MGAPGSTGGDRTSSGQRQVQLLPRNVQVLPFEFPQASLVASKVKVTPRYRGSKVMPAGRWDLRVPRERWAARGNHRDPVTMIYKQFLFSYLRSRGQTPVKA